MLKAIQPKLLAAAAAAMLMGFVGAPRSNGPGRPAGGYVCHNHHPSHYARTAAEVDKFTDEYGCKEWSSAEERSLDGVVRGTEGGELPGVQLALLSAEGGVIATGTSGGEGRFRMAGVPSAGTFVLRATLVGFATTSMTVDMRRTERVTVTLGGGSRD